MMSPETRCVLNEAAAALKFRDRQLAAETLEEAGGPDVPAIILTDRLTGQRYVLELHRLPADYQEGHDPTASCNCDVRGDHRPCARHEPGARELYNRRGY